MKKLVLSSALIIGTAVAFTGCAQNNMEHNEVKKEMKKGSCGAGKCGSEMKDKKSHGSCGAGKCGADMKKDAHKKATGSCGAGKCG